MASFRPLCLYEPSSPLNIDYETDFDNEGGNLATTQTCLQLEEEKPHNNQCSKEQPELIIEQCDNDQQAESNWLIAQKRLYPFKTVLRNNNIIDNNDSSSSSNNSNNSNNIIITTKHTTALDTCKDVTAFKSNNLVQNETPNEPSSKKTRGNRYSEQIDSTCSLLYNADHEAINTSLELSNLSKQEQQQQQQQDANDDETMEFNTIFKDYEMPHDDDEVFGFGLFKDECITEEDLQQSMKKLGEEAAKSQQEQALEAAVYIRQACQIESKCDKIQIATTTTDIICKNNPILLCHNSLIIGSGQLVIRENGVIWHGRMLSTTDDTDDTVDQSSTQHRSLLNNMGHNTNTILLFLYSRLSDIRAKYVPDNRPLLLATYDDATFVQFAFPNGISWIVN
ncbi:hypothetical protein BDF19DRAFT_152695 [Syncephalis fuscata]|nr:hypothetical protein BDF19DRAFT_152695 [Syncephalis fuscata]